VSFIPGTQLFVTVADKKAADEALVWAQPQNAEHFGNSGVYIYDKYEVQINSSNVPFRQAVPDQPPSDKTQLTPGWPYKVPQPTAQNAPVNFAQAPGTWNRMRITFTPPVLFNGQITQAAKLKVSFEFAGGTQSYIAYGGFDGWELLGQGGTKLIGTGDSRSKGNPLDKGSLFLQSHWGSLVEFKNPSIVSLS
jgi:hypothetical protein